MQQNTEDFDALYKILNEKQKEAVDTIEGPVMVIAGPGTGKTQILTLRIANILRLTDIPPDAVLALTFTNAAAANMRKRLVSIIGSDAYRVSIYTFHSFANHIIDTYPERFLTLTGRSNCSEIERIDILRSLIDSGHYTVLKPIHEPYHNVPRIISAISHLKREGITPMKFETWLREEKQKIDNVDDLKHTKGPHKGKIKGVYNTQYRVIEKNHELADLYKRYQKELVRRHRFDFEDSLLYLIEAMEQDEIFLQELQENFHYFLVDEHQDSNGAQNRILELLAGYFDTPNLFVVGDEKQAIFRFQGASIANFLHFESLFKDVKRITLETNYRSRQGVLDAAQKLIEKNQQGIVAPLFAHNSAENSEDKNIKIYNFDADDEELLFLAESVKNKLADKVPAHELSVLVRNNSDIEPIADYFERLSIPFTIESGHGVLDDPDIQKLNLLMKSLLDVTDNDALAKALFINFLHIPLSDIYLVLETAKKESVSIFSVLQRAHHLAVTDQNTLLDFSKNISRWKKVAENDTFLNFFETVVKESGLLEHIQHSSFHTEKFDKLVRLFDEIKALVKRNMFFTLEDYLTFLSIIESHNIQLEAKTRHVPNAVRLMTAHKAKGLEFDYVFIAHAYDGHWGGKRNAKYFQLPYRQGSEISMNTDDEDERRLFYVAITRARKDVFVSYSERTPDGRDRVPSQFIEEIDNKQKTLINGSDLGYAGKRPPLFVDRIGRRGKEKYLEFVKARFNESGISATALNNYLTCPWKWFYENFFYTQFVPSLHQIKGTAVHTALENFFKKRNQDPTIDVAYLLDTFAQEMERAHIEPIVLERLVKETSEALSGWYKKWHTHWEDVTKNELFVRGILLENDIRITGKIDTLECLDEKCRTVRVVDYKTGKPRSRNEIEGKTKQAQKKAGSGGYKRQLVFYKLLLDLYADGKYVMKEAVLDFVEPMISGNYKREVFEIEQRDVEDLKHTIQTVANEIRALSFWDERCDDELCSACRLRELMEEAPSSS